MKTYIVDSFTNTPFKGNPAGVCFPEQHLSDQKMLYIAQELGLSETAFIRKTDKSTVYSIRYFSPKKEIPLCGHATLASAKVLFTTTGMNQLCFITGHQVSLPVLCDGDEISMEFPVYDTVAATVSNPMLAALGLTGIVNTVYSAKNNILMLEIESADELANLKPDFNALIKSHDSINGVLITAKSVDEAYDYHYRYFWPWAGTNEDPVTGGVQTFLAKYWSIKLNKTTMKAYQSSARTGYMDVKLQNDKVLLTSRAIIMLEGDFVAFDNF